MITLDVAALVVIAGRVLGIDPAAALDRLDLAAAQAALAEARQADVQLSETVQLSQTVQLSETSRRPTRDWRRRG